MPENSQRRLISWVLKILIALVWVGGNTAHGLDFKAQQGVIVIDPGHGGNDTGGKGPDGAFEKTVGLNLARILAVELGKGYRVILTRTDDYGMEVSKRTSAANHASADVFISIHTGGSFLHQANGLSLYFYKEPSGFALAAAPDGSKPQPDVDTQIPWDNLQARHKTTSSVLANLIRNRINQRALFLKSQVQGAPLMVLSGADMPAVLLEVGYISNPAEEKALLDINTLTDIAKGVRDGIDDFFEKVR